MSYWGCARLELRREAVAQHFLKLNGYETYIPRVREQRLRRGKRIETISPLFPAYAFIVIEAAMAPGALEHRRRGSNHGWRAPGASTRSGYRRPSGARSPRRSRASEVIRAQTWGSRENPRRTISRAPGALRGNETTSAGRSIARAFGQPAAGDLAAR